MSTGELLPGGNATQDINGKKRGHDTQTTIKCLYFTGSAQRVFHLARRAAFCELPESLCKRSERGAQKPQQTCPPMRIMPRVARSDNGGKREGSNLKLCASKSFSCVSAIQSANQAGRRRRSGTSQRLDCDKRFARNKIQQTDLAPY